MNIHDGMTGAKLRRTLQLDRDEAALRELREVQANIVARIMKIEDRLEREKRLLAAS